MAKKARKKSKPAKKTKTRAKKSKSASKKKTAKRVSKRKAKRVKKDVSQPHTIGERLSSGYHIMVDTVTGTEKLRNKMEKPGTDETE